MDVREDGEGRGIGGGGGRGVGTAAPVSELYAHPFLLLLYVRVEGYVSAFLWAQRPPFNRGPGYNKKTEYGKLNSKPPFATPRSRKT